jgi:hypothetical protein
MDGIDGYYADAMSEYDGAGGGVGGEIRSLLTNVRSWSLAS